MSRAGNRRGARLPRGPHGLDPDEVAADQQRRLIAAMIALAGEQGYAATMVSDVIAHAEVSRKTFYEHFRDRHDLLVAAFDASAPAAYEQIEAAADHKGGATRRLEALMRKLCRVALESPGAIALSTVEVAAANPVGLERRDRLMRDYGDLIERCLDGEAQRLPDTLAQALAGSVHRTVDAHLRDGDTDQLLELAPQLARWTRSYVPLPDGFLSSEAEESSEWSALGAEGLVGGRAPGTLTLSPSEYRSPLSRQSKSFASHANRERLLDAVAQLTSEAGYVSLTAQGIAERADVSERAFLAHFKSKDEAFEAAVEVGHLKAMAIAERARATARDWRSGVRNAVHGLVEFLASEPYFTRMAFVDAPLAGPRMARRTHEYALGYARLMLGDAPQRRHPPDVAPEAAAHGLFELAFHMAIQSRAHELTELSREATYLMLAPFVGVSEAAETAGE